jgi:hypothetical protein
MKAAVLMSRLLEVERAIGKAHPVKLREMVLEAQGCVLELEQEMIDTLRECGRLRERMENCKSVTSIRSDSMLTELMKPPESCRTRPHFEGHAQSLNVLSGNRTKIQ